MTATTIATVTLGEAAARLLADTADVESLGADAIDVNEQSPGAWRVTAYFRGPGPAARKAFAALASEAGGRKAAVEWRELPDADWVKRSQEALPRVRAGRFLVYGAHTAGEVRANDVAIHIEAGLAFGTGHHATTRGCLLAIEAVLKSRPPRAALDIGTGSGVLAIALARRGVPVDATDIDPVAVRIARDNARLNRVVSGVAVRLMPAMPRRLPAAYPDAGYDLIVANILMQPLLILAPAIARAVAPGGAVILSGLLPDQRRPIVAAYRSVGLTLRRWFVHDGWLVVVVNRPARLRRPRAPWR
jgi:ribosomal protein L11 methyltransferase